MVEKINKSILVYDDGIFQSWCEFLTRYFTKVYYFNPWQESDVMIEKHIMGSGIPNVEVVEYFHEIKDKVDIFFFTDINFPDVQMDLRRQGKQVWGLGWAEEYEKDRRLFRDYLTEQGMNVNNADEIDGLTQLKQYLQTRKKGGFVKASKYRHNWETYHHQDPLMSEEYIDAKIAEIGCLGDRMEFIIEDEVDGIEIGMDAVTMNGEMPEYGSFGVEVKDKLYLTKIMPIKDMPKQVLKSAECLEPMFRDLMSMGHFSTEVRVTKDGKDFFSDFCARLGNPPNSCLQEAYDNWGEVIDGISQGKMVQLHPKYKYACECHVYSNFSAKNKTYIKYPEENNQFIKMRHYYIQDGKRYKIPKEGYDIPCTVVGVGDTPEEAIDMMKKIAKTVECNQSDVADGLMDKAIKILTELEDYGVKNPFEFSVEEKK